MSKCIICKQETDGFICKHCLVKGASDTSNVIVEGGKVIALTFTLGSAVKWVATKVKRFL